MKPPTSAHCFEALRMFAAELIVPPRPKRTVALSSHQRAAIQEFLDASLAENTRKAYAYYWRQFTTWCQTQGYGALPADPVIVAAFLAELAPPPDGAKGASVSTITIALSASERSAEVQSPPQPSVLESRAQTIAGTRSWLNYHDTAMSSQWVLDVLSSDTTNFRTDRHLFGVD